MAYDPQRNRARAQPSADEPAPVDMVLEGTTENTVVEPAVEPVLDVREEPASVSVEPVAHEVRPQEHEDAHVHGPECDHEHGPDLRLIVAAGVVTVVAAVVLRRRRAARR